MSYYDLYDQQKPIDALVGKTVTEVTGMTVGSGEIKFHCADGSRYMMYHQQDCCESVSVEDVCGDVSDLIGSAITLAEESSSGERPSDVPVPEYAPESETWTFYRIGTARGMVTIRWLGESNGYYSESVDFAETHKPQQAAP